MKNKVLFLLLFAVLQAQAQIEGYWKGAKPKSRAIGKVRLT